MGTYEYRTYEYRIYPSNKQKDKFLNQFRICKEVYNIILSESQKLGITRNFNLGSLIVDVKRTCPSYYYQVYSQVYQNVGYRLHKAFESFFRRLNEKKSGKKIKPGYPRFKSKVNSITYPQPPPKGGFKFLSNKRIKVGKIGSIPIILHRVPKGRIKTLTIKQNRVGQWFAYFYCELEKEGKRHSFPQNSIGIDVGLEYFAALSNGKFIDNPNFLIKSEKRLKRVQRRMDKKKIGSANRRKAIFIFARQHLKIANQRNDFLHKLSCRIVRTYSFIAVEDLNINDMISNHFFAKGIGDVAWGSFINMLSYKAVTCGGQLVKNPKTRGSSNRCNKCGAYMDMPLSKRIFHCPNCGLVLHRDLNAALNHLKDTVGLTEISTPVEISSLLSHSERACGVVEAGTICQKS